MASSLRIQTLGSLLIALDGQPVEGFDSRKAAALLVYLACTGRAHPREPLAEMLWEERAQAQALANLRVALTSLRQQVGEFVEISRESVGMAPDSGWWLDVAEFERRLDAGSADDLAAALDLYQGDFLAGFYVDSRAFEDWMLLERERLRLSALEAHDRLIGHALEGGDTSAGIARASQLLQMDPLREKTYRQLMQLLALSGQREAALAQYETCRRLLAEELGVEPTAETAGLYQQLRSGEAIAVAPQPGVRAAVAAVGANPYKGLRAFQESDAPDFFGRETLTARLIARLQEEGPFGRFLAVVGPSGSGKSSVVRAGLLPALRRGELPGAEGWCIVSLLPGPHPFDELDVTLARVAGSADIRLLDELKRDPRGLLRAARRVLPEGCPEMLLVVDQFEEVFTLVADPAEAKFLLDSLYAAVTEPRSPLRVLITLRADFYDRPLMYPNFSEMVRQRTEAVVPLSTVELERAISGPAERVNVELETGLAATIVGDVAEQPGALPMLQYALTELFDQRADHTLTLETYHAIGGALGALARRADAVYQGLGPAGQAAARQILLRLVTLGEGTEDIRRRVSQAEIVAVGGADAPAVLDAFDRSRLLSFDKDPASGEPTVELAHEAIIRAWGRLRAWLDESRQDVRQQRLLGRAATEWLESGREASYLLTGSRLAQAEEWAGRTGLALTPDERAYLAVSGAEERRRATLRRRVRYGILIAALLVAVVMSGLALLATNREQEAQEARATSIANAAYAQELALVNGAQAALAKDDIDTALALAVAANRTAYPSGQAQRVLSEAAYSPGPVRSFVGHQGALLGMANLAFSPDGRYALSGGQDNRVILWDVATGAEIQRFEGHINQIQGVSFGPDARTVLSAGLDGQIILWDVDSGEAIRRFQSDQVYGGWGLTARLSPDGRTLLSSNGAMPFIDPTQRPAVLLWDVDSGEIIHAFVELERLVSSLAFTPDGDRALSGGASGELSLWDLTTYELICRLQEGTGDMPIMGLDVSPDGRTALSISSAANDLILWDLETCAALRRFDTVPLDADWTRFVGVAFGPDGRMAISGGNMTLWDVESGRVITRYPTVSFSVAFSPDGRYVLSALSGEVRLWAVPHGAAIGEFQPAQGYRLVDLSPDGQTLLADFSAPDGQTWVALLDASTGEEIRRYGPFPSIAWQGLSFSPDGQRMLICLSTPQRSVEVWDVATGERRTTFLGHRSPAYQAVFSPDGRTVLSGDTGSGNALYGTIVLWDAASGQEIRRLVGHEGAVWSVSFSPDGRRALSSGQEGTVIVWDLETGQIVHRLEGHTGGANDSAFSPDGRLAISGDDSGAVIVWDVENGVRLRTLTGHTGGVLPVAFSPDGRLALSSSAEVTILWDVATGEALRRYPAADLVLFSRDGRSFYAWESGSNIARQYRIDSADRLLAWTLDNRAVRELTCAEREQYRLEPYCDAQGVAPTAAPILTLAPTATASATPSPDLAQTTATLTATITPTLTPVPVLNAQVGEQRGEVVPAGQQVWLYAGRAGEALTIRVNADQPANWNARAEGEPLPAGGVLDTLVLVIGPDGTALNVNYQATSQLDPVSSDDVDPGLNTNSLIEGLVLPEDATYRIEVYGMIQTGGAYTLTIESVPPEE